MILHRRKRGAQRGSAPVKLTLDENLNTAGQGGTPTIVLFDPVTLMYHTLELENEAEYRELLSAVQKAGFHV